MSRDGSGSYSLPEAAFVYDTVISETAVNNNFSDIANALTQSLSKDGQTTPTANLPMGGYKHTGVANATGRTDYAAAGQVQDGSFTWCGTAGGTKNSLTLTPTPAVTAYAAGQRFRFKAGSTQSDDAVTIAVSGLTAKAAQINDSALSATVCIEANKHYEAMFDGTAFQLTRISASAALLPSNNLSDLASPSAARTNLGLGAAAVETVEAIRQIPQNSQSAAYTLVLADAGKHILHPSADTTARIFTIPANATVAFPVGTAITFVNQNGAGSISIAITSDTMRLAGAGTTGTRTLAANGVATALKIASTEWIISGTGLS